MNRIAGPGISGRPSPGRQTPFEIEEAGSFPPGTSGLSRLTLSGPAPILYA